jgi:hypothetical protein
MFLGKGHRVKHAWNASARVGSHGAMPCHTRQATSPSEVSRCPRPVACWQSETRVIRTRTDFLMLASSREALRQCLPCAETFTRREKNRRVGWPAMALDSRWWCRQTLDPIHQPSVSFPRKGGVPVVLSQSAGSRHMQPRPHEARAPISPLS